MAMHLVQVLVVPELLTVMVDPVVLTVIMAVHIQELVRVTTQLLVEEAEVLVVLVVMVLPTAPVVTVVLDCNIR